MPSAVSPIFGKKEKKAFVTVGVLPAHGFNRGFKRVLLGSPNGFNRFIPTSRRIAGGKRLKPFLNHRFPYPRLKPWASITPLLQSKPWAGTTPYPLRLPTGKRTRGTACRKVPRQGVSAFGRYAGPPCGQAGAMAEGEKGMLLLFIPLSPPLISYFAACVGLPESDSCPVVCCSRVSWGFLGKSREAITLVARMPRMM